jgi:DNA-binding protein H-NS
MSDFSTFSVPDLHALQNPVAEKIRPRTEQEKGAAPGQILAIAERAGVSLKLVLNGAPAVRKSLKATAATPIRYRNPDDKRQQRFGRGRQPHWARECLNSGNSLDHLKVD